VLVQYETPTGRVNKGVATTFLAQKHPHDGEPLPRVPIFIRKSQFRLPTKPETPIIMIGPGTGLAPFRGFIQERDFTHKDGKTVGDSILYFGCRKRSEDYLYEDVSNFYDKIKKKINF
jgi:NADPH-ferrihemoprotein reductase